MPLVSILFAGVQELEDCQVHDRAHLTLGTKGHHVRLVQTALIRLRFSGIHGSEYRQGLYGKTTADAVLRYKKLRNIINRSYQTVPDNIVGKMTITSLDREMLYLENQPSSRV